MFHDLKKEEAVRRIQVERQLLPQRLLVFLTADSILFLGFATLEELFLKRVIVWIGLAVSIWFLLHFIPIFRRLEYLNDVVGRLPGRAARKGWEKGFSGRTMGIWFSVLFIALWGLSFFFVYFR